MSIKTQIDRINNEVGTQTDLIAQISAALEGKAGGSGGITPTGTLAITENGTFDVTEYASAEVNVPSDMPDTVDQATPSIAVSTDGLITASATQTAGYVEAGTKSATKQLTTQAAETITPGTSNQTAVASGRYTTGEVTVEGDSNLVAENIKSGVSIFGVSGSYTGSGGDGSTDIEDALITRTLSGTYTNSRITTIGDYAFCGNENLTGVSFPNVVDTERYAFSDCTALVEVEMPKLQDVGIHAFENCTSLSRVNLPAVTYIDAAAFAYCTSLATADFPNVEMMYFGVFDGCSALVALILRKSQVAALYTAGAFYNTPIESGAGYIYVPSAIVDSYKADSVWKKFADQFRALEDYTVDGTTTGALDESKI